MRAEHHIIGCRDHPEFRTTQEGPEHLHKGVGDCLVIGSGCWGHDELAVDEFVAQAIVRQGVKVGAGE